jgi:signal transduction histidine kinase
VSSETPSRITLKDIDIRELLPIRPCRARDYELEQRALAALAREMTENPRNMLQKLVETAIYLCGGETAGVSLLEEHNGTALFRWEALAGVFASQRNNTMPRDASPCGVCIDENRTQLMYMADRLFPALLAEPPFVEALLIPFHARGQAIGTVWVVSHTEGRSFDREDERLMEVLAQFAAAAWQLWKSFEESEKVNRHKDEFLAILGHELRNPLAAITGAVNVLRSQKHSDATLSRVAQILCRQTDYLSAIVGDLLDVSRITSGKLNLQKKLIELQPVIELALEITRPKIEKRRQHLTVTISEAVILDADSGRLTQMLVNLLENAIKYTPEEGEISLTAQKSEREVKITLRDNGMGIPAEKLAVVFDLFTQLGRDEISDGGLGLGLPLVRTIAELHGGIVEARSEGVGMGAEFTVRLPIHKDS